MKKVVKIVGTTLLCLGLLLLALLILTHYFFPNELVRRQLESRLSETITGKVTIQSLSFNLLSGLHLTQVDVHKFDKHVAHLDKLLMDYNLWHVFRGTVVLNEVRFDRMDVSLDLEDLQGNPADPASLEQQGASSQPLVVPLMIDLKHFSIRESNFSIARGEEFSISLSGINLEAALQADGKGVDLSGTLSVGQGTFARQGKEIGLPLESEYHLTMDWDRESLTIASLNVQSPQTFQLALSGTVGQILSQPVLDLSLSKMTIWVDPLSTLIHDVLPPRTALARLDGVLDSSFVLHGSLLEKGFDGTIQAQVQMKDLQGEIPSLSLSWLPSNLTFTTRGVVIQESMPQSLPFQLQIAGAGGSYQQYAVKDLVLSCSGEQVMGGSFSGALDLKGLLSTPPLPPFGEMTQPLSLVLDASGHAGEHTLMVKRMVVGVGDLIRIVAQGYVGKIRLPHADRDLSASVEIEPRLPSLLQWLPPTLTHGLHVTKARKGNKDVIKLEAKGQVTETFAPLSLDLHGDIHLSGLTGQTADGNVYAGLKEVDVALEGSYRGQQGGLTGKVLSRMDLSGLTHGSGLRIGQTLLQHRSSIDGSLTSHYELKGLTSRDSLTVKLGRVQFQSKDLMATLHNLAIRTHTQENVLDGQYRVHSFQASSGTAFRLDGRGWFTRQGREFFLETRVPYVNMEPLLQQVSGVTVQALRDIQPSGRVSLALKGAGQFPSSGTLDLLHLPVAFSGQLDLKNVTGAFQGTRIVGANGSMELSYRAKDRNHFTALSDLRIDSMTRESGGPLSPLRRVFASLDVTAEAFDRIGIQDLHVGFDGANVSFKGSFEGLRDLLEGKARALSTSLGPLFAQGQLQAAIDLEKVSPTLKPYGISGTGQTELALNLLKKEQGIFDTKVQVTNRHLSLRKGQTQLRDLHGTLSLRKLLEWAGTSNPKASGDAFSPVKALPKLQPYSSRAQALSIKQLEADGLDVSNVTGGILFDGRHLSIRNLAMNVLNGGLGGNVLLKTGKTFSLKTKLEGTQLDLNTLLGKENGTQSQALVDGIVDLDLVFDEDQGKLDIERSDMDLHVPTIGRDALDRLLSFLDPTGTNPSIVGARATVRLVNPSSVRVTLNKGLLGLKIVFQQSLLQPLVLNRFPLRILKNVPNMPRSIPQWDRIRDIIRILGATHYGVNQDGTLLLR